MIVRSRLSDAHCPDEHKQTVIGGVTEVAALRAFPQVEIPAV
jgi:hypothetical protein